MQFSNFAGINNKISKKSLVTQFIKNEEDEEVINELEQELNMSEVTLGRWIKDERKIGYEIV